MATSVDLARQLLGAAENDELMARSLLPVEGVTDAGIGYHAQQAVEKAIKAVLAAHDVKFRFSHNLDYLKDACKESGIELPSTLEGMEELTPFAAAERYGSSTPIGLDRAQALAWAATAVEWARQQIEPNERAEDSGSDADHPQ
ncbi:MAG: HEPN domain-containing protein [Solirubrobacteraceae bacterium]